MIGYFEEEAVTSYTEFLDEIDKGSEKNRRKRKRGNENNYSYNNKKRVSIREEEKLGERENKGGRI